MKFVKYVLALAALSLCVPAFAQVKPCEELVNEIDEKLKEKGVQNYTLEIVPNEEAKDRKVVGSCDGGTKKIIYTRDPEKKKEE